MRRLLCYLTVCALLLAVPVSMGHALQPDALIPLESEYTFELAFDQRNDHSANSPVEIQGAISYLGQERSSLSEDTCRLQVQFAIGARLSEFRHELQVTATLMVDGLELEFVAPGELRPMLVQGEAYLYTSLTGEIDTPAGSAPIHIGIQAWQDKAQATLRIGSYDSEKGMLSLPFGRSFNEMSDAFTLESCWPDGRYLTGETKPFVVDVLTPQGEPAAGALVYIRKDMDDGPITLFSEKTDDAGRVGFDFDKGILDLEAGPHNFSMHVLSSDGGLIIWHWYEPDDFLTSDDTLLITARFGELYFQGEVSTEHIPTPAKPEITLICYPDKDSFLVQRANETLEMPLPLAPQLEAGHLLVPLRPLLEQLGYQIQWQTATRTILIHGNEQTLRLVSDNHIAELNGQTVELGLPASIHQDRAMIPLRHIAQLLGHSVKWDSQLRQAVIR